MINDEIFAQDTMVTEIFVVVNWNEFKKKRKKELVLSDTNVDKSLTPVPLLNKTLEDNAIYSTPIVVIAGWEFRKRMNENDRFFFSLKIL